MKLLKKLMLVISLSCSALAQRDSLLIGPGDEVHIQVFDTPSLEQTARVSDEGELPLLLGGSIHAALLTPTQAARQVEAVLVRGEIMYSPRVLVTVVRYATQNVTVFGQVVKPGSYSIGTPRSLLDVISLAGGLTVIADRNVTVERHINNEQVTYFISNNAEKALSEPVMVYPGDRVMVPNAGIVYVLGDVGRPGGFPMNNNDSQLTALQLVALAGTAASSAVPNRSKLIRRTPDGGYTEIPLQLSSMQKGQKPDVKLQAGDIIYVPFSYLRNAALGLTGIAASAASAIIYTH